ncbi:MAG: aminotransferase class V-fold PLP-dependent enzyme [Bacteroidota bacterium]
MKIETTAIKSTENHLKNLRPVSAPLYLSTTFHRNEDGTYNEGFLYTRHNNPNRQILEQSIATLENGKVAYAFSSGMAAISAIFQSLKAGDHVILPDDVYFNIYLLCKEVLRRWDLQYTLVDMTDLEAVELAFFDNTALVWIETPSNPQLKITDIQAIADLAHAKNALVAVDNTWPSPVLQQPLDLGADIVMHSTTKYFGGHSDVLGGCVVLKEQNELAERLSRIQVLSGAVPSPFDCWLVTRGIQTLPLRVKTQSQNAMQLAQFLEQHLQIERVLYPGLESHPQYEIAKQQMKGFGGMLAVLVKGDAKRAIEITHQLKLFTVATSLGGVESLIEHRKSVEGEESLTPDNLLRLSIGLENVEDLIADWEQALKGC